MIFALPPFPQKCPPKNVPEKITPTLAPAADRHRPPTACMLFLARKLKF